MLLVLENAVGILVVVVSVCWDVGTLKPGVTFKTVIFCRKCWGLLFMLLLGGLLWYVNSISAWSPVSHMLPTFPLLFVLFSPQALHFFVVPLHRQGLVM